MSIPAYNLAETKESTNPVYHTSCELQFYLGPFSNKMEGKDV
jgi:hypothetical protein